MSCFQLISYAQNELKGLIIGGSMSISNTDTKLESGGDSRDVSKEFELDLYPSVGYMFENGFVVGGSLGFSYSSIYGEMAAEAQNRSYQFGPFVKYYMGTYMVKPLLLVDFRAGNIKMTRENFSEMEVTRASVMNLGFGGG